MIGALEIWKGRAGRRACLGWVTVGSLELVLKGLELKDLEPQKADLPLGPPAPPPPVGSFWSSCSSHSQGVPSITYICFLCSAITP